MQPLDMVAFRDYNEFIWLLLDYKLNQIKDSVLHKAVFNEHKAIV